MRGEELVKAYLAAFEAKDFDTAAQLMTDDFTSRDGPVQMGKEQWIATLKALITSMPDFSANLSDVHAEGNTAWCTIQITGTHTHDLVVPGLPPIPATGKKVSLPRERLDFTIRGNQIASETIEQVPGGSFPGILAQLGVQLPQG